MPERTLHSPQKRFFEPYSLRASNAQRLALCAMLRFCATLAEQLCLPRWRASFPTRLRCVICAAAHLVCCAAKGENPFFSVQKEKYGTPKWVFRALQEKELRLNLTPMWRKVAIAPLVHCTMLVFNEPPRSNFACLPGKRAFRLGCAALSAPSLTM